MPSGAAHRKLAFATSPLLILSAWGISNFSLDLDAWETIGIVTAAYLINPVLLSPDCDLPESAPSNRWGIAEPLLWPLQMVIHRGNMRNPLSHWPPLSSVIRMLYLWMATFLTFCTAIFVIDAVYFGIFGEIAIQFIPLEWFQWWWVVLTWPETWWFIWGITIGDLVHTASDIIWSYMRK